MRPKERSIEQRQIYKSSIDSTLISKYCPSKSHPWTSNLSPLCVHGTHMSEQKEKIRGGSWWYHLLCSESVWKMMCSVLCGCKRCLEYMLQRRDQLTVIVCPPSEHCTMYPAVYKVSSCISTGCTHFIVEPNCCVGENAHLQHMGSVKLVRSGLYYYQPDDIKCVLLWKLESFLNVFSWTQMTCLVISHHHFRTVHTVATLSSLM